MGLEIQTIWDDKWDHNWEDAPVRTIADTATTTIRSAAMLYWELAVSALSLIPRRATR
jgi:hypothetical protein